MRVFRALSVNSNSFPVLISFIKSFDNEVPYRLLLQVIVSLIVFLIVSDRRTRHLRIIQFS